jgi:glycosyltransferase involved in cell wall biosynthesis
MSPVERPRYLFVLASSCQMYSGTGTAVFDFIDHCLGDFKFAVLMDVLVPRNFGIMAKFCRDRNIALYPSEPLLLPGCVDCGVAAIAAHLSRHSYEFIECISWASASTNLSVLNANLGTARLLFTPHSQPLWTVPDHHLYFMIPTVFRRMVRDSHAVFVDSRAEMSLAEFKDLDLGKVHVVSLGVDVKRFHDNQSHRLPHILFVGDAREPRKRMDLLMTAFERAVVLEPGLRLLLTGNGSDSFPVPSHLESKVKRLGYVSPSDLVELYQTSSLLVLLSDYEAFGLPVAEALCCGLPVLLNKGAVLEELFAGLPGVHWTVNSDLERSGRRMATIAAIPPQGDVSQNAQRRFGWEASYGLKRKVALNLIA